MRAPLSDRLPPWIAGSLLLLVVIVLVATQVPSAECGGENDVDDNPATALLVVTVAAVAAAIGAALYRIVAMATTERYSRRDGRVLGAALLVLAVSAIVGASAGTAAAGLAIGGLILAGTAFVAIVVAAVARMGVDDVGILLPIYLFGAAWVYLAFGVLVLFATSGVGC